MIIVIIFHFFTSIRLCLVSRKYKRKCEEKKIKRKDGKKEKIKENKNRFKINKLFLHAISNSFYLFSLFNIKIK